MEGATPHISGLSVGWVYQRCKEELIAVARDLGLDDEGRVEDLRKRLSSYIQGGGYSAEVKGRLTEWEARFSSGGAMSSMGSRAYQKSEPDLRKIQESGSASTAPLRLSVPTASSMAGSRKDEKSKGSGNGGEMSVERRTPVFSPPPERHPPWNIAEQVRKWGMKYDGRSDPLGFIEILEERAITYGIELDRMPRALSEVLVDKAAKWFLTSGLRDVPWLEFKKEFLDFFLPPQYLERLEDQIRARRQREGEPFKDYLIELRLLMRQARYSPAQELNRAYENASPEYRLYVRRHDFSSLTQLTQMAAEFENVRSQQREQGRKATVETGWPKPVEARQNNPFRAKTSVPRSGGQVEGRTETPVATQSAEATSRMMSQDAGPRPTRPDCEGVLRTRQLGKRPRAPSKRAERRQLKTEDEERNPLRVKEWKIVASVTVGGQRMTATIDTGATRSFVSEDCVRRRTIGGERRQVESRIRLADGSALNVTEMVRTDVSLAGKTAEANLLIMPTMLDHVILGMDFLCAIGTTVRCGNAELEMRMIDDVGDGASPPNGQRVEQGNRRLGEQRQFVEGVKELGSEASHEAATTKEGSKSAIAVSTIGVQQASSQGTLPDENRGKREGMEKGTPKERLRGRLPATRRDRKERNELIEDKRGAEPPARVVKQSEDLRSGPEEWSPEFKSVELEKEGEPEGGPPTGEAAESEYGGYKRSAPNSKEWPDELETREATESEYGGYERSAPNSKEWPDDLEKELQEFLEAELALFEDLEGVTHIAEHSIRMKDDKPLKQRYYPKNPAMQKVINEQVDELLQAGAIEPSKSPHSAPIVLVKKKTGDWRMCVDYRQLNANSVPDAYPVPRILHILEKLRHARFISTLDLKSGYWQIPMAADSREYTAFTVPGRGLFQWRVMPFGLHSAGATFQRALDTVIGPDMEPHAFAYLDDIVVIGATKEQHVANLKEVFRRLRAANLRLNRRKCSFFREKLAYLGHVISGEGICTDPAKVEAIQSLPSPSNLKELRQCLGMASWYRRFVPNFASLVQPMTKLLKKGQKWIWSEEQEEALQKLKESLTTAPVLACPDFSAKFVLQTDASDYGLGAVLTQEVEGQERVIAYASRKLLKAELNYSATEKECLAIVWAIRKMRCYLEGYRFDVVTDHLALKWLNSIESPTGRIARWALELQQYQFDIRYRRGSLNVVADALSRQPMDSCEQAVEENPPCWWIARMRERIAKEPEKFQDYVEENGQLYRNIGHRIDEEDFIPWKLCVPSSLRGRVMRECHDAPTAGHQGVRKTAARLAQRYYWPGMFRDAAKYVKCCETCQRFKCVQQKPAGHMLTRQVAEPMAVLCADFVGPLPRSKRGNTMLLVFHDAFAKWVELVPLRKATTAQLQLAFRERIISRFGVPRTFVCDNGVQFTSRGFKAFMESLGVTLQHTAPYTPQENPTERTNRTVKTMIAQYIEGHQSSWDELLPEITLAVNSSVADSTGFTPAFLMLGREPRLPAALYDEVTPGSATRETQPEAKGVKMKEIFDIVRSNLQRASKDQGRHYNLRRRDWRPALGSAVLSPNVVRLTKEGERKRRVANIAQLKPFHQEDEESDTIPETETEETGDVPSR
ncbi:LOW QUALITY PROTEIN: uncharacterized protein LOC122757455 [Drosophila mojavensis]|uniref:LOW QUALITY PROTEIN: uncharacterized protein LOC122757455 n=1 Tax=Drosophila mojavensis TaxID=7230 RepID=UPI001CD11DF5|nr:LOW QUALITY PROTEIN: uncharacterized protein LOC122757455 [Drosophila mojavensis]